MGPEGGAGEAERLEEVRAEAERARERLAYLAEAGATLSGSLDLDATLETVAWLAVPRIADWCAVYLPRGDLLVPLAVAHADPGRVEEAWAQVRRYPMGQDDGHGTARAFRTGEAQFVPVLTDDGLALAARDPEELAGMRRLGLRSFMAVPMRARGETIGVISFAASSLERRFSEDDLALAVELARRSALAVDNAGLYREARDLNTTLERKVEERTRELAARNADLEAFVYTASHDLRAPLLSIRGMADLLEGAVAAGDAEEAGFALSRVKANAGRMEALLDDLLALSRVGGSDEAVEVDLGEVVGGVVAELEGRLRERGLRLELPTAWPRLRLPRSEAEQVLANLLGNAAKFAGRPGDPPRVAVSWSRAPADGLVTLRVADNGPGVPEGQRERVFELFRKLDPKAEGTGVGLAIVKRIAERRGGGAWVEVSELGGAAFAVAMPAGPA